MHYTVEPVGLNDFGWLSNYLYINIDNNWKYVTIKLVSVLAKLKDLKIIINLLSEIPVYIYQNKSYIKPLNNWNNPDFFIAVFLPFLLLK